MNSRNIKLDQIRLDFIGYAEYCYNKNKDSVNEYLVDSFLFDNITFLSNLDLDKVDLTNFTHYISEQKELELFVVDSLSLLKNSLIKTRKDKSSKYIISQKQDTTIENIFMGLTYSGNNDSGYNNIPSALSLATFSV